MSIPVQLWHSPSQLHSYSHPGRLATEPPSQLESVSVSVFPTRLLCGGWGYVPHGAGMIAGDGECIRPSWPRPRPRPAPEPTIYLQATILPGHFRSKRCRLAYPIASRAACVGSAFFFLLSCSSILVSCLKASISHSSGTGSIQNYLGLMTLLIPIRLIFAMINY